MRASSFWAVILGTTLALAASAHGRLTADQLVLVVNADVPESRRLAEHYAATRGVPDGRIVALSLPTGETISREAFVRDVLPALRREVATRGLSDEARCVVTFYGVPLKVDAFRPTADEAAEYAEVSALAGEVVTRLAPAVERAAATAAAVGAPVPVLPELAGPLSTLLDRLRLAEQQIGEAAQRLNEGERASLAQTVQAIRGDLTRPFTPDAQPLAAAEVERLQAAVRLPRDADARRDARALARRASLLDYAQVVTNQLRHLSADQSDAAFDSELAALPITDAPASLWMNNPLQGGRGTSGFGGDALMVARLDGPTPRHVRDLITTSVAVERAGLTGRIAIDSRGLRLPGPGQPADGYAPFDEQLRQLAGFLRQRATLEVVHDDLPDTFATGSVEDVAVYVGWYRLRDYNRPFTPARGAVGYHVASYEMVSLRNPGERGWVKGLLEDGIVATVGPVSEPYLHAFPPPGAFFPLVLAGEVTLAEAYWATVPHVSWKMGLIGDPLYRPFAAGPALRDRQ